MTAPASSADQLRALARTRGRIAGALTAAVIVLYFGFIALIAFDPALLGKPITAGLSLGILLGALVIVGSWLLTWFYVCWANAYYDTALKRIGEGEGPP